MTDTQVFWTGGIGDILALEATMTDEFRKSIRRMYWATRSMPQMAPLFTKLPSFSRLNDHVSLWDNYQGGLCFKDMQDAYDTSLRRHLLVGPVQDWSVIKRFEKPQPFTGSSFVKYKLASISEFNLPSHYTVVCPYSDVNKPQIQSWRRFHPRDWEWLTQYLANHQMYGVVVNTGTDPVPENKWLINLSNKTTLGQALEIVKQSKGYIGIDMAFSVLAAQMSKPMLVATTNAILWAYKHLYYAPQTYWQFIVPHLGATEQEIMDWREKHTSSKPVSMVATV
jgi:hypothetical protein